MKLLGTLPSLPGLAMGVIDADARASSDAHSAAELRALDLLERYHQAVWVDKRTQEMAAFMSESFHSHSAPAAPPGSAAVEGFIAAFFAAFPDLRSETLFNLADGDRVVTAWAITGTQQGELFGMPASGRAISVSGIDVLRVKGDRFEEHWFGLGLVMPQLLQQLAAARPATAADPTQA